MLENTKLLCKRSIVGLVALVSSLSPVFAQEQMPNLEQYNATGIVHYHFLPGHKTQLGKAYYQHKEDIIGNPDILVYFFNCHPRKRFAIQDNITGKVFIDLDFDGNQDGYSINLSDFRPEDYISICNPEV